MKQYEAYAHIMAYEIMNDTLLLWICSITERKKSCRIVARSREKSRSLSLVPFLARCRSLSLPGLVLHKKYYVIHAANSDNKVAGVYAYMHL